MARDYNRDEHEHLNSVLKRFKYNPTTATPDNTFDFIKPRIECCDCCDASLELLLKRLGYIARSASMLGVMYELKEPNITEIKAIVRKDLQDSEVASEDINSIIDLCTNKIENLTTGRALLNKCIRHLKIKTMVEQSLWEFIVDDLKFKMNSGYDYLIMTYLDTCGITEHGTGIRCSWLIDKDMDLL